MATALVTGISGQDGAYLARHLLERGWEVVGTRRRSGTSSLWRLEELGLLGHPRLTLGELDLADLPAAIRLLREHRPSVVYNLAALSFVGGSFAQPIATTETNAIGPLHLLEAILLVDPSIRFYQASTSEMFGKVQQVPQTESTPFWPRSPYGFAKLLAHWATVNYREARGLFACSGILFNHESPLRGSEFVTRKLTLAAARAARGIQEDVELGNLDARRDWGFAGDYVEGMAAMLAADQPADYVLATGRTATVRDFAGLAFAAAGLPLTWSGQGLAEVGHDTAGRVRVRVSPAHFRPAEVDLLVGSPTLATQQLGWVPRVGLEELCSMMVEADLRRCASPSGRA